MQNQGRRDRVPPQPRQHQVPDIRGKHRKQAELNRLNHEIQILEAELQRLIHTDHSSVACKELIKQITETPDPLLPRLENSINPGPTANRWFEQPLPAKKCCWLF